MTTIRVLIADDHPVVRAGIRSLLERAPDIEVIGEAHDGIEAMEYVSKYDPDVLVLDIEMPKMSGLEVAQKLGDQKLSVKVLALSAHDDFHYIEKLLQYGACGYLVKEEIPDMIVDAVRGVATGEQGWLSRRAAAQMSRSVRQHEMTADLTDRELDVLRLIVQGKTNQEIAMTLKISMSTVEKHVGSLITKLHGSSRVDIAVFAVRQGLV